VDFCSWTLDWRTKAAATNRTGGPDCIYEKVGGAEVIQLRAIFNIRPKLGFCAF